MPTYDYLCTNCGDRFEHFQTMAEQPLQKCKKCDGQLKRLIGTGLGPIFKGSGFYQTDYKSSSKSETKSSEKTSSQSTASKTESKKETTK